MAVKSTEPGARTALVQIPALPHTSCVTLEKLLNLSEPLVGKMVLLPHSLTKGERRHVRPLAQGLLQMVARNMLLPPHLLPCPALHPGMANTEQTNSPFPFSLRRLHQAGFSHEIVPSGGRGMR